MSTVSGPESVRFNPVRSRTRPGLRGRRLVLTCLNEHRVPEAERVTLLVHDWRCKECGERGRKYTWYCAPLAREGWEWMVWGLRKAYEYILT